MDSIRPGRGDPLRNRLLCPATLVDARVANLELHSLWRLHEETTLAVHH